MVFIIRQLFVCMMVLLILHNGNAEIVFYDNNSAIKFDPNTKFVQQAGNTFTPVTGTLINVKNQALFTGNPIFFTDGFLSDGVYSINLTATYDPSMTSSIQLVSPSLMNVVTPGKIPYKTQVSGTDNELQGLPKFQNPNSIAFNNSSALTISILNTLNTRPTLSSTLNLGADLVLGDNVIIEGAGQVNFNGFNVVTGKKDLVWTSTLLLSNASNFELSSNSMITGRWTFEGVCHIEGNGYKLKMGPNGQILIRPNSSLLLNNVVIEGPKGGNIGCMDCTGTVSFGNVLWKQDTNFTFTTGGLDVLGLWELVGTSTFTYSPCRTGNVVSQGTIQLDEDMTFLYAPPFNNRNMLVFEDSSAVFAMDGATLASTFTGMTLTNGTLITQSLCFLTQNTGKLPALSEGIQFGNGNPVNEMTIIVGPSSVLDLLSGRLFYNQAE